MFDDRRRGAGIDRSHPLKPITTTTTTRNVDINNTSSNSTSSAMKSIQNGKRTFNSTRRKSLNNSNNNNNNNLNSNCTSSPSQLKKKSVAMTKSYGALANSNAFVMQDFDDMDNLENETFPKEFSSMSLDNNRVSSNSQALGGDRNNNNSLERNALNGGAGIHKRVAAGNIKLKPLTKKLTNTATPATTKSIMRTPITSSGSRAVSTPSRLSPLNSPKSYIPGSSGTGNKLLVSRPIM